MKKTLAMLMAIILCFGLLAGCSGGGDSKDGAPPADETTPADNETPDTNDDDNKLSGDGVELTVVSSYGGDDGNRQNFENAIKDFEAATGNTILSSPGTSNEEWKAKVMADFETGTEPDVLFYFSNADSNSFIEAGKVVSLDEVRTEYPEFATNMKEEWMATSPVDGKIYAVPSSGFWESMFVNKTVLEAAGVPVPGPDYTWEQFLTDCETIKDAGFIPIAASLQEVPHYWFEFTIYNRGNIDNHLDIPEQDADGNWNEAGQKWIDAFEDLKELYDLGYFPENTLTASDPETVQLFGDGDAAFLIDGSWKVGYFNENHEDELQNFALSFVPGKGERKASDNIGGISMGYFITRKAWDDPAKRDAAVQFVMHMTSDETVSDFVTIEVTALKNGATPAGLNEIQQSAAEMSGKTTSVIGPVQDGISPEARGDLFANVKNIITGQISASDAIAQALELN